MLKKEKEITIKDLDKSIESIAKTVDSLAMITKKGFDSVDKKFDKVDKRFDSVDKRFGKIDREVSSLKIGQGHLLNDMEEVKDSLKNLAPYYELKALQKRIEKIELKLGLKGS